MWEYMAHVGTGAFARPAKRSEALCVLWVLVLQRVRNPEP